MMTKGKIMWLAGYLEGEGSFTYKCYSQRIGLQTTDADVILKVARMMGGNVGGPLMRAKRRQPIYYMQIYGPNARKWMRLIRPYMGLRRREQINAALDKRGRVR